MTRYGMVIDVTRCSGCYNCQIACKDEHCGYDYPGYAASQPLTGHFWMKVTETERGQYPKVKLSYTAIPCMHCQEATCIEEAKNGAVYRRNDGIIIIDPEKAKGQQHLIDSCPYGVIYWNEEKQLPQKCTFCAHLLDDGWKEPRCVEICPAGALCFGDLDDPESEVSKLVASSDTEALHPESGLGENVRYIGLPGKFVAGTIAYADTDECAAGITVTLSRPEGKQKIITTTDGFGDFEFEGLDDDVEYILDIRADDYESRSLAVRTQRDVYLGVVMMRRKLKR